ncbi:hypothetical protein CJU90_4603 [Yarrowia sp. C11]|nr:hypothetical protein CJU90_4603 [Yarrowia sp. C11]KAG5370545.1 hypothetical protein CKK34_0652 [Yarrowia sp. E02]
MVGNFRTRSRNAHRKKVAEPVVEVIEVEESDSEEVEEVEEEEEEAEKEEKDSENEQEESEDESQEPDAETEALEEPEEDVEEVEVEEDVMEDEPEDEPEVEPEVEPEDVEMEEVEEVQPDDVKDSSPPSREPSTEESDRSRETETEEEEPCEETKPKPSPALHETVTPRKKVSFTFQSTPNTPTSTGGILKRKGQPVERVSSRENLKTALVNAAKKLTQKDNLGGPDDSGFGDGGQRFSIYSSLNGLLRVDVSPEDMKCLVTHARVLSECAKNDIMTADQSGNALDTRVIIQAVRFLAYLLEDQTVAETVDPDIISWIVNQALNKISDSNCSKSVLGGYLHLLSHHRVCKNVVTPETTSLLYTELSRSEKKSSTALTSEVLSIYQTVAVVHPARALQHASLWLPRVVCLSMDVRSGLRSQALSVLSDFIVAASPNSKGLTAKTTRILTSSFSLESARNEGAQLPAWLKPKETLVETILHAATDCPAEDPHYELWGLTLLMAPMDAESSIHSWNMLPHWMSVPASSTPSTVHVALLKACRYVVYTHTRKHLVKYPVGLQSLATRSGNTLLLCIQSLGRTGNQLIDQQCLSLFNQTLNSLLLPLETPQLTLKANSLLWDSYIRPSLAVMCSNSSLANVACASLACLLRYDQKTHKDREPVFSTSIRQLVTSLAPRWVKTNYDKIIDVIKTIPLDTSGPSFMVVWTALVNNILHSSNREIHPSPESSGFVMSACKLHRHMTSKTSLDHKAFYSTVFQVTGLPHCIDKVVEGVTPVAYMFETLVDAEETPTEAKKFLLYVYSQLTTAARRLQFTQSIARAAHRHDALYKIVLDRTGEDIKGPEVSNLSPTVIYTILASPNRPAYPDTWMSILKTASEMIRKDAFLGSTQEVLIEPLLQNIHESLHAQVCLLGIEMIDKKPRGTSSPMFRSLTTDIPKDFMHLGLVSSRLATVEIVNAVRTCLNTLPDHSMPCFVYRFASVVMKAIMSAQENHKKFLSDSIIRKLRNGPMLTTKVYMDLLTTQVFPAWFEEYKDVPKKKQTQLVQFWNELIGNDPEVILSESTINLLLSKYVSVRQEVLYQGVKLEKPTKAGRRTSSRSDTSPSVSPNVSPTKRRPEAVPELEEPRRNKSRRLSASPVKPSPLRRSSPRLQSKKEEDDEEAMRLERGVRELQSLASRTDQLMDELDVRPGHTVEDLEEVESTLIGALFKLNQLKKNIA